MQLIITFNSWWLDRVISNKVTSCFVKNKDGTIKKEKKYLSIFKCNVLKKKNLEFEYWFRENYIFMRSWELLI